MTKSLEELKKDMRRNYSEKDLSIAEALDEAIEMGYRAGQEGGRNEVVEYISNAKMEYITEKDVLTYKGERLSTIADSEKTYVSAVDLDKVLEAARTNKQEV